VLGRVFAFAPTSALYFAPFRGVEHPLADFLGVRVVLSNHHQPPKSRLERVDDGRTGGFLLFRNRAALPRWFVAPDVEVAPQRRVLDRVDALADGRRVVVAAEAVGRWRPAPQRWEAAAVRLASPARPGAVDLTVGGAGERLLATSLPGPHGWRAHAGGRPLPTVAVNGAYLGVRLPAGAGRVELRYRPPGLVLGTLLALLAALALAVLASAPRLDRWIRCPPRR
jgi:hypothetical protein